MERLKKQSVLDTSIPVKKTTAIGDAYNKQQRFKENRLGTANKPRSSVEFSKYKHVVLSLIFLKFVSEKFEKRQAKLVPDSKGSSTEQNVFYQLKASRWAYIQQHTKLVDI